MIAIISHPDCLLHNTKIAHPECPERLRVIAKALHCSDISLSYIEAPLVTYQQLSRVHDEEYLNKLFALEPKENSIFLDPDTIFDAHTLPAALRAAGAVIKAVDLLMSNEMTSAFCTIRPPGHHAEHNRSMGFCFFNNIAVGVAHALNEYPLERVAIVDFDVHRGNGTEDIFYNNEHVFICSIYEEFLYPAGEPKKAKNIVHIPLPSGATGSEFRTQIIQHGLEKINAFKPQIIFLSAGFDGHTLDTISSLNLEESDYYWITQQIQHIAAKHSQNRIISVLEGGYALSVLGQCAVDHIKGLITR
jgi:acetoin utilization deacetylase AcuC-like enzyme